MQPKKLDVAYIRSWLKQFSELLENPALQACCEQAWKNYLDDTN